MRRIVQCLLVAAVVCLSQGTTEYDLSLYCGNVIYVYDAAIFKVHSYSSLSQPCTVNVYSEFHVQPSTDRLRLEIRTLNAPCWQGAYLNLYDGFPTAGSPLATELCSGSGTYRSTYLTGQTNLMTIEIHTGTYNTGDFSLELLATATSYSYESGDFVCNNLYDVVYMLTCDGYNNCGDWSDEQSSVCDTFTFNGKIWVIVGSATAGAVVLLIVLIVVIVQRRRRLQKVQQQGFVNRGQNYGTIQGVAVSQNPAQGPAYLSPGPAYLPAPPPYSGAYGAAPPPAYKAPPTVASSGAEAANTETPASAQVTP